jgi:predicted phosphoadenosine phosphosulfate sulfurtransferase
MKFENGINNAQDVFGDTFDHKSFVYYNEEKNELSLDLILPNANTKHMDKDLVSKDDFEEHYRNIIEFLTRMSQRVNTEIVRSFKKIMIPIPTHFEAKVTKESKDKWIARQEGETLTLIWNHHDN